MRLYEILEIESAIDEIARNNEGEITEEQLNELITARANNVQKVSGIIKYIKHLEYFIDQAKAEKQRVSELQKKAENRINSIKRFMSPLIQEYYGGQLDVDTFRLSFRKSESVELDYGFNDEKYCDVVIEHKPRKAEIKAAIKKGIDVPGARLIYKENLQIK